MFRTILRWLAYALSIVFISWMIPGISVENFLTAMLVAVVMALINAFVKPVLRVISLPINLLTLGLFSFVLNALLFMLAGVITPGFEVDGFLSALFGSLLLSLMALGIEKI